MELDGWQKLTDISLKGVAMVAIGLGTLWYTSQKTDADKSKICAESLDGTFKMVVTNRDSEVNQAYLNHRLQAHEAICGKVEDQLVKLLKNAWLPADGAAAKPAETAPGYTESGGWKGNLPFPLPSETGTVKAGYSGPMWVATARRNDSDYSAINFDVAAGNKADLNAPGNVLAARWSVNIRAKNTPVSNGDNPVVGLIVGGECVKVLEHQRGTLNEWVRIERSACPAGA